ncbi:DUF4123 domain-containing protein [Ascidiaceihabitans sp.]|uniref:DUF4123 domain-containing protein n=1 Tax=Ascidiaceihabitans sp. TaxID=1872644 RepID=UPI003298E614
MSGEPTDPWTNAPSFLTSTDPRQNTAPQDFLNVTHHDLPSVEPDDDWISPLLGSIVFPTKDAPDVGIYLCVDETLCTNFVGLFDLDVTDADMRCLFTGEAEDKWKESAPYLVDITPDAKNSDGTNFCQHFFSEHWGKGTGIILIIPAPMHAVWRHLRRFTRVRQSDTDGWFLFRFWDPRVALPYFSGIRLWGDRSHRFFAIDSTQEKLSMVIEHSGGAACTQKLIVSLDKRMTRA